VSNEKKNLIYTVKDTLQNALKVKQALIWNCALNAAFFRVPLPAKSVKSGAVKNADFSFRVHAEFMR
jgi:hypothetical protein